MSVEVRYRDRLGNNLFQYAFGRLLAEGLRYRLNANPIPNFDNTREAVDGDVYAEPVVAYTGGDLPDMLKVWADRSPRRIVCHGWFQDYRYYRFHLRRIRQWFDISPLSIGGSRDVFLHLRLGDYVHFGQVLDETFYLTVLRQSKFDTLHIITDEIAHPYLQAFSDFRPHIPELGGFEAYRVLRSAKRLILSASTFSWWAAWTGDAEKIWYPVVPYRRGMWGVGLPPVGDSRYEFIAAKVRR